MTPITLHEDNDAKIVQLHSEYHPTSSYENINELKAIFTVGGVELYRLTNNCDEEALTHFGMSATELDALCSARETFPAEQEQKRIAEVEAQAYALADTCKAVQIKRNDRYWTVFIPETSWESVEPIYSVDHLLSMVKEAVAYYQPIAQAYELAATCPAIRIKHEMGTALWFVYIAQTALFEQHAHQDTIVQTVKQAIDTYVNYQDQLIKTNV